MTQATIRVAGVEDAPLILSLIKELAEYERLSHEVIATEEQLGRTLFGERRGAEVLIAEWEGEPEGFALFFHNYSTFLARQGIYLEDLYVRERARGRGIGGALLRRLAQIATERGCGRLEWSVLDWNEPAIDFYKNLGATPMDGWTIFRATGKTLEKLAEGK